MANVTADAADSDEASPVAPPGPPPVPPPGPPPVRAAAARDRTQDVVSDASSFRELMVSEPLVRSLAAAGFDRPSPVQKAAIPLGRVGTDLIVQAKSGTGKTVVFAVICLERVKADQSSTQALVLAPTREIAIQSEQVIRSLAAELPAPAPTSGVFVGGLPMVEDEKKLRRLCHIAVGTPGRVSALLQAGRLAGPGLGLLVLDEADSLLGDSFYEDVTWIYDQLPKRKQVLAFSATYSPELLADLEPLMRRPQRVMMCAGAESVSLLGVKQFFALLPAEGEREAPGGGAAAWEGGMGPAAEQAPAASSAAPAVFRRKVQLLLRLLAGASFHQAAVFCNHKPRAEWLAEQLSAAGYPAAYLSGDRAQTERMEAMEAVRGFKLRVVVSTDVMARGVDLERVNLVVNLDLPHDAPTYMHRVGRTGRFGSRGVCVSYVTRPELALLVSYVMQQQQAGAAAAAAAAAAATANGGGSGEEAPAAPAPAPEGEGAEAASEAAAQAAAKVLLPLPEVIPEDLYGYELGSDWERQALQRLVVQEQQARQQLLQGKQAQGGKQQTPADGAVENGAGENGAGEAGSSSAAANGAAAGPAAALPLPELPPLPEEVKAAKKAEAAAQAAAEKAEKELQKQLRRQQQEQEAAAAQAEQQRQAYWDAYGYGPYSGYAGHGSYSSQAQNATAYSSNGVPYTADAAAGASASSRPDPAQASYYGSGAAHSSPYGAHYPDYSHYYQHAYGYGGETASSSYYAPQYGYYGSPSGAQHPGGSPWSPGPEAAAAAGSGSHSPEGVAAAWSRYYSQWQYPHSGAWPGTYGATGDVATAGAAAFESSHTAAGSSATAAGKAAGSKADARVPGHATVVAPSAGATAAESKEEEGEDGEGELEEGELASELSFGALRGEVVGSGASGTTGAAAAVREDGGGNHGEEGGGGEEEDEWEFGAEEFPAGAASAVDNLVVLLPPAASATAAADASTRETAAPGKLGLAGDGAGVPASPQGPRAHAPGTSGAAEAGAAPQHGDATRDAAAAYAAHSSNTGATSAPYGYQYDPYTAYGGYGQQWPYTWDGQPGGSSAWAGSGGAGHPQAHHPPHHGHRHHPHQHHQHHHGHHHHHPPGHQRHGPHHAPPPPPPHLHGASYHYHATPVPPPPHHPYYGQPAYAYAQSWHGAPSHAPPQAPYGHEWHYGGGGEAEGSRDDPRCPECVRRVLREYVRQCSTWQQSYGAWYEQYRRWYEEWLRYEAAGEEDSQAPSGGCGA